MKPEYYEKLKALIKNINEDPLSAKSLLKEAPSWKCSNWKEKGLFEDLIIRSKEYLELEEKIKEYGSTILDDIEHDRWRELMGWFSDLSAYNFNKLKELFLSR
jgi:hypothetical protein